MPSQMHRPHPVCKIIYMHYKMSVNFVIVSNLSELVFEWFMNRCQIALLIVITIDKGFATLLMLLYLSIFWTVSKCEVCEICSRLSAKSTVLEN